MTQILLLSIYPKYAKTLIHRCISMFITTPFTQAKIWKQTSNLLTNKWVKKMQYILYIHKGLHSDKKEEGILYFPATKMELEEIMVKAK